MKLFPRILIICFNSLFCYGSIYAQNTNEVYKDVMTYIKNDCDYIKEIFPNQLEKCSLELDSAVWPIHFPFADSTFIYEYFHSYATDEVLDSIVEIEVQSTSNNNSTLFDFYNHVNSTSKNVGCLKVFSSNYMHNLICSAVFVNSPQINADNEFLGKGIIYVFLIKNNEFLHVYKTVIVH